MKVTFNQTRTMSETGHDLIQCQAGQTYDLAEGAAITAIRNGWATKQPEGSLEDTVRELNAMLRAERLAKGAA